MLLLRCSILWLSSFDTLRQGTRVQFRPPRNGPVPRQRHGRFFLAIHVYVGLGRVSRAAGSPSSGQDETLLRRQWTAPMYG